MINLAEADQTSATPIRVFLIDEEVCVRAGMRILIDSWSVSKVVGEADSVPNAKQAIDSAKPDLIVFSHSGRTNEMVQRLLDLVQAVGQAPLVLLTGSRDPKVGTAAVKAGAKCIIRKQDGVSEFRTAIEKTFGGEVWFNKSTFRSRNAGNGNHERRTKADLNSTLTNREREVAVLVSKGCTNRQVGDQLGITEVTVRHHLSSIFNKLGIANRFELIAWVYRRGMAASENYRQKRPY